MILDGSSLILYDSLENEVVNERIIVLRTKKNLRALNDSQTWFDDGTFETASTIFVQMLAILGFAKQVRNGLF